MKSGDNIGVIASQVVNDSTGAKLTATQTVTINFKDLATSGAVDITGTSISLTWDNTNKCFYIANSDLSTTPQEGHSYVGQIADSGVGSMRTIPIYFEVAGAPVALSTQGKADVNAQMVDVITVDAIAELSSGAPSATPNLADAVMLLYMALRNEATSTSSLTTIANNAGTVITQGTVSETSSQVTRGKLATP